MVDVDTSNNNNVRVDVRTSSTTTQVAASNNKAQYYSDLAGQYASNAANSANAANTDANKSKIWAEGSDNEVQALGGTHSSKGWVEYVMENAPTASVTETEDGALITITDINGTTTAEIYNGQDGTNGTDGIDGFSPTATVTKSGNVATITITDKNGTTTATVTDGAGGGVFIAVYGTTSVSDIQNAYSSQKSIFCEYTISGETQDDYDIILLPLTSYIERVDAMEGTTSSYHFTGYNDGITYTTYIDNTDVWGEVEQIANNYANDDLSNVSSISSSSAVYTEINNRANRNLSNLTSTGNAKFQAPLVSGINIKTINNNSILGSGDIPIQPVPDIDAKSITTNSSDELQTVGVIDQNATTTAIKTWTGTKAEYDALNQTYYAYANVADEDDVLYTTVQPLVDDISIYSYTNGIMTSVGTLGGASYSRSSATAFYDENNEIVYREDSTKDITTLIDNNTLYNITDDTTTNNFADTDLSNISDDAKILMGEMSMPSNRYVDLTLGSSGSTYTAPADGYYTFGKQATNGGQRVAIFNFKNGSDTIIGTSMFANSSGNNLMAFMPVKKGDVVNVTYDTGGTTVFFRFIYAVGSESEAS